MTEAQRQQKNAYMKEYSKMYREKHPERVRGWQKKWLDANREKYNAFMRDRYQKNIEAQYERSRKYHAENKNKTNEYKVNRYHTNSTYRLANTLRARLKYALRKHQLRGSTLELLGCSIEELKLHIEALFQQGMSWENHSRYGWHLDHIVPLASFDLTDPEQLKKAAHYSNLQPLWARENWKKNKY